MNAPLRSPTFIGGLSYSGKTQLRIVIGAHPDFCMTRRTYMWERFYGRFGALSVPRNRQRCLDTMCGDADVRRLGPDRDRIEREFATMPPRYATLFGLFHRQHADRVGARRWGEQLGFVERFADPIFESEPDARMIHMIRDPRTRLRRGAMWAYTGAVGWETARWLRSAELARRNERRYPHNYLVVRYEELRADTRECTERILEFIGERHTAETEAAIDGLSFSGNSDDVPSARFVDRQARDALSTFGYVERPDVSTPGACRALELSRRPTNVVGMTAWRVFKDRPLTKRSGVGP